MSPQKKVRVQTLLEKKQAGEKIVAVTAYDYPTALLVDEAGVDMVLVGDSVGNVVLGYESTARHDGRDETPPPSRQAGHQKRFAGR